MGLSSASNCMWSAVDRFISVIKPTNLKSSVRLRIRHRRRRHHRYQHHLRNSRVVSIIIVGFTALIAMSISWVECSSGAGEIKTERERATSRSERSIYFDQHMRERDKERESQTESRGQRQRKLAGRETERVIVCLLCSREDTKREKEKQPLMG